MDSTPPNLLIVDDNEDLRAVAREALAAEGYEVHAVGRAEAALRLFEERGDAFDLVVTNVYLPGMTGIDLANRLRAEGRNVRIVLASSRATEPDLQARLALGDVEFLDRPFSLDKLTAKVDQSLRKPEPVQGSGSLPEDGADSEEAKFRLLRWLLSRPEPS